ncbi:SIMPL domain-containing protein, partial [Singulisphaera rosea]
RGTGKLSAAPDIAEITVGVRSQAPTAQQALASNNEAMNSLHEILKGRGVAAKDIQTTQIQIFPQYSQPAHRPNEPQTEFIPKVVGYQVDNNVQVTARQIPQLGGLLDALVQAGANQIHGISFRLENPEKLLDQARKHAMADARRKAEILVGEAGVVLGNPLKIVEDSSGPIRPGQPPMMRAMMAAAPMPIAPGEQELNVNVQVIYLISAPK